MSDLRSRWPTLSYQEKNALIAEKVMGWKWQRETPPDHGCLSGSPGGWWKIPGDKGWTCASCHDLPLHYTEHGQESLAFEVVEKMRKKGYGRYKFVLETNGKTWEASFRDDPLHDPYVHALTVPEAICLAALLAVGVK